MIDAVKPDVSDETLAQEFARLVAEYHGASEDDPTKPEAWNLLADFAVENGPAISAALAAQGQEPVAVKALEWRKEHQRHHAYALFGGSYVITQYAGMAYPYQLEARGFSGSLAQYFETLIAAKAAAQSDYETRILSALNAPARPVGVPVGYVSTVELHTLRNIDTCVDLFSMPPDEDGFQFVPVYAAPQPPAEGGWKPMEQIGNLLRQHIEAGESHGGRYDSEWLDRVDDVLADLRTHLAAPANGGEQNG